MWTAEQAREWYAAQPWPCGFNYVPANAISYTEMFMDYAFNTEIITKELALAKDVGFNCVRFVLPFIVWEKEPETFKTRLDTLLTICHKYSLKAMPCLFDDCCFGDQANPLFGKQPDVIPGWYGNGWTPSPGHDIVRDSTQLPRLESYVKDIISSYKDDPRVWVWDLYNEPTNGVGIGRYNSRLGDASLPLLESVFRWARKVNPSQPLTVGKWDWDNKCKLDEITLSYSDIITFHSYSKAEELGAQIKSLTEYNRPIICTEWMNRCIGSTVYDCLPVLNEKNVGAMHWGLVNGKTQTHLSWGSLPGQPVGDVWQHDLFIGNHSPYDAGEIALFKQLLL